MREVAVTDDVFAYQRLSDHLRLSPEEIVRLADACYGVGDENPALPAGYTYLAQFVAHDLTLRSSAGGNEAAAGAGRNERSPSLDLETLYGRGASAQPRLDGDRFVLVAMDRVRDVLGHSILDERQYHDVPRQPGTGIADMPGARNDDNALVAQFHVLFMRFHNAVVQHLSDADATAPRRRLFARARDVVAEHYQSIVLHDLLRRLVQPATYREYAGNAAPPSLCDDGRLPLEVAAAGFRLHSMVRPFYRFRPGARTTPMSAAMGPGRLRDNRLRGELAVDWRLFFEPGFRGMVNKAQKLAPVVSRPLGRVPRAGAETNVIRGTLELGERVQLCSGEAAAALFGVRPLARDALLEGASTDALRRAIEAVPRRRGSTPLWLYLLCEASATEGGQRLGELGSRMLCDMFHALLRAQPGSIVERGRTQPWRSELDPDQPAEYSMPRLLAFVERVESRRR